MAMIECAGCKMVVDEADTYFCSIGTVCFDCHAVEEFRDRAEFRRGSDTKDDGYTLSEIMKKLMGKVGEER